ncbi:autophagy-like protein [Wolffia australiana]
MQILLFLILFSFLYSFAVHGCELSVVQNGKLYNFSLESPSAQNPHGVLSEDGFYKIVVNDTSLWFQLCSQMIFNHDPPRCLDCEDCGGPSHCGMECSALVSNFVQGYPVCTTIGQTSSLEVELLESRNPSKGVTIKTRAFGSKKNCSLSVGVHCDVNGVGDPELLEVQGFCDYGVVLRHPAGCPKILPFHGRGLGWFGTLLVTALCLLGAYFGIGIIYRFFFLRVRGADVIPHLQFWSSLPQRLRVFLGSLARSFRGQRLGSRTSYSPMNF